MNKPVLAKMPLCFMRSPVAGLKPATGLIQISCLPHSQQTTSRIALERAQPEVFRLQPAPLLSNLKTEGAKYFETILQSTALQLETEGAKYFETIQHGTKHLQEQKMKNFYGTTISLHAFPRLARQTNFNQLLEVWKPVLQVFPRKLDPA